MTTTFADMNAPETKADLRILIDGNCPLCRHEAELLTKLDKGRGHLEMVNIADPAFEPARFGLDHASVNRYIHAITREGEVVTGLEVFRRAYGLVGWGWLWAPTGWPVLRHGFNVLYRWFAKNRHRLTFRSNPCPEGTCGVDARPSEASRNAV